MTVTADTWIQERGHDIRSGSPWDNGRHMCRPYKDPPARPRISRFFNL